jgi:SH3/ankyrin repeat-containing protein
VNKLEFQPSAKIPALQYVGDVEPGGEAEKRGVKKGDYILEVCLFDFSVRTK